MITLRKKFFFELPKKKYTWMQSHAQLPSPMLISKNEVRVFFATRCDENKSSIAYVDLEMNGNNFKIKYLTSSPVMSPGLIGTFDEHGVFPSCIVKNKNSYLMYYIGWNKGFEAPLFYSSIGLAISNDGIEYRPISKAPIISRGEHDPCLVTSPFVYIKNNKWHIAYVSGIKWTRNTNGNLQSHYHIKTATGETFKQWEILGNIAIDFKKNETNIARPSILIEKSGLHRMMYSYVDPSIDAYRLGYAESHDGDTWVRMDEKMPTGLDNDDCIKSSCYPSLFRMNGRNYVVYNGDGFGRHGFCLSEVRFENG